MELGMNPTLPDVELVLGGKLYHLCFDFNAIIRAEKETGINLLRAAVTDVSATTLRGLLYASLLHENPDVTLEEIGPQLNFQNIPTVNKAIRTAWFGSIPSKKDGDSGEDTAQTPKV